MVPLAYIHWGLLWYHDIKTTTRVHDLVQTYPIGKCHISVSICLFRSLLKDFLGEMCFIDGYNTMKAAAQFWRQNKFRKMLIQTLTSLPI